MFTKPITKKLSAPARKDSTKRKVLLWCNQINKIQVLFSLSITRAKSIIIHKAKMHLFLSSRDNGWSVPGRQGLQAITKAMISNLMRILGSALLDNLGKNTKFNANYKKNKNSNKIIMHHLAQDSTCSIENNFGIALLKVGSLLFRRRLPAMGTFLKV